MVDAPDGRNTEAVTRFRRALEAAGYTEKVVGGALGVDLSSPHPAYDRQVYARRLAEPSPLNTLIKLFVLGLPVPARDAESALTPLSIEQAAAGGLVAGGPHGIRRVVSLTMLNGLWLIHDPYDADRGRTRADHVLSAGPASRTLAALTLRVPCESALDLGTGCGVQALLTARHSGTVVATDTNPRALRFTEFNAVLNEIPNVQCREGSFYQPVDKEQFDLIVSNPPFVISPEERFQYRDSDLPGDVVSERVVRGAAEHLSDGGYASILCNWAHGSEDDWSDPPSRWVEGIGCDVWVLASDTQDALSYAATWLTEEGGGDYSSALDRWLGYYRELGVAAITTGAVILRRRETGDAWVRMDRVPGMQTEENTQHVLRVFRNQDYMAALAGDDELLDGAFCLAPDHRVEQVMAYREGSYQVETITLRFEHGLRFVGTTDPYVLRVLSGCDGSRSLRDLLKETATMLDMEVTNLASVAAEVVRRMLSLGFLEAPEPQATD